jgi:hypothetical protein
VPLQISLISSSHKRPIVIAPREPYQLFTGTSLQSPAFRLRPLQLREDVMKQSDVFRENAENCAQLAEAAGSEPAFQRYKRMEASWRALADEQDWLDGEISPAPVQDEKASAAGAERSKTNK